MTIQEVIFMYYDLYSVKAIVLIRWRRWTENVSLLSFYGIVVVLQRMRKTSS